MANKFRKGQIVVTTKSNYDPCGGSIPKGTLVKVLNPVKDEDGELYVKSPARDWTGYLPENDLDISSPKEKKAYYR